MTPRRRRRPLPPLPENPAPPPRPFPSLGHNNGPPLDPEESWRGYVWRRKCKQAWKAPREIALRRLARAEELGMSYREYTLEILERGRFLYPGPGRGRSRRRKRCIRSEGNDLQLSPGRLCGKV